MTTGLPLEIRGLSKTFGAVRAVDDLTFSVAPGVVTGFLGPNGAGKTTTLRCLLGLVQPSAGHAWVGGRPYRELENPLQSVGAALEAASFHPGRSARDHLRFLAQAGGLPASRVTDVLRIVGIEEYADRRVGGFSLGMRQRLGLAQALLGDPGVLVLDEPANGLDPAGIAWLRGFLRALAAEGRTVLVSSHVLSEVQQTVDEVVVIAHGRLVTQGRLRDLEAAKASVLVRTPERSRLAAALAEAGAGTTVAEDGDSGLSVHGSSTDDIGRLAFAAGVELHELSNQPGDLERLFLDLTSEVAR
ncbi:MAG TPA: ATP-binding cassette domain-containing protein [Marmoricola sp.]|nr:ATP-binding cassette domain-containing protein [Marmoricola sp.]